MKTKLGQTILSGDVTKVTDGAVLFEQADGTETWIPRSVCIDGEDVEVGDSDLIVADWWLDKNGVQP